MKIKWSYLLSRLAELESSEFSKTQMGKVVRKDVVVKVGATKDRDIWIILENGPMYLFPNATTWAFLGTSGDIFLMRDGEPPYTSFTFRLKTPFVIPEPSGEEKRALLSWVLSRL